MKFITNLEQAKEKIITNYPKFKNSRFEEDNSGWCNYAVKVDEEYIFRFSRNQESYRVLKLEYQLLEYLKQRLPNTIQVPEYIFSDFEENPFVGYKMIRGKFLRKDVFEKLNDEAKENLLKNMSIFLNTLHSIEVDEFDLDYVEPISNYKMRYEEFKKKCFDYFNEAEKQATINLFETYFKDRKMVNYKPTVIHGDLSEDHILITDNGIGIIDFGDARVFDPAFDFEWAYLYGKSFFDKLINLYQVNYDKNFEYRISNFYLKIVPYYGIVYGAEIKNNFLLNSELERIRKNLIG